MNLTEVFIFALGFVISINAGIFIYHLFPIWRDSLPEDQLCLFLIRSWNILWEKETLTSIICSAKFQRLPVAKVLEQIFWIFTKLKENDFIHNKYLKYIQFNLFEKQDAQTLNCSPDTNFSYDYANSLNSLLSPIAQRCGFF